MQSLPCAGCKGMCCGPVPITAAEFKRIRKTVKTMPVKLRKSLETQHRFHGTCIFYDQEHDQCGIHAARPGVCRAFGHFGNLVCFRKPEAASTQYWFPEDKPIGVLSQDFTWKDFT